LKIKTITQNPYKPFLTIFFDRLIELQHAMYRLSNILNNAIKDYPDDSRFSGSGLIISDITGETDRGWEINFHTGSTAITEGISFKNEVDRLILEECRYTVAQSFESLERLLKHLIFQKTVIDPSFVESYPAFKDIQRHQMPGGKKLIEIVSKSCRPLFNQFSDKNNYGIRFSEFFKILLAVRCAIVHDESLIKRSEIFKSQEYQRIYNHFFTLSDPGAEKIEISLNQVQLAKLIKYIAQYGFQIFKMLSIKSKLDWSFPD
jgi:hypothetical protein